MKTILAIVATVSLCLFLAIGTYSNLDLVKSKAEETWKSNGFKVIGYDGYQFGTWLGGRYGGARVWYKLNKIPDNGITYQGFLWSWGDEIHIYNNSAIDAIKP